MPTRSRPSPTHLRRRNAELHSSCDASRRLQIPSVGPMVATALIAEIADPKCSAYESTSRQIQHYWLAWK